MFPQNPRMVRYGMGQKDKKVAFFIYKQWMKLKLSRAKMVKNEIGFFGENK